MVDEIENGYDGSLTSDVASSLDTMSMAFPSISVLARAGEKKKDNRFDKNTKHPCALDKVKMLRYLE